jgi:hypothetical protein
MQHLAVVSHDATVILEHGRIGGIMTEVLGDFGICKALVVVVVLVADRGVGTFMNEGPRFVGDTHDVRTGASFNLSK